MEFNDLFVDPERRFTLGVERDSGCHYLSIPVANRRVDYEEHYRISPGEFEHWRLEPAAAEVFVARCRRREADDRLFLAPGPDRGIADTAFGQDPPAG